MNHETQNKMTTGSQRSIKFYTSSNSGVHERTKRLIADRKNQERGKRTTSTQEREKRVETPPTQTIVNPKRKTPPSLEKDDTDEITKRLHFSDPSPTTNMSLNKDGDAKETSKEDLILARLDNIQESITQLQLDWKQHTDELLSVKHENITLTQKVKKLEKLNSNLNYRVRKLEDKLLETNIVFQGVHETTWESEEICREKIVNIIATLVNKPTAAERMERARLIPIDQVRRLGRYNSLRTRPVVVNFSCKGDADYVLMNRRKLREGIFVDKEYSIETASNRQALKPIFNAARKMDEYKGKCRLDGDTLTIHSREYNISNLHTLPDNISGPRVSSKQNDTTFAFFGELNPLSNFYPCNIEFNEMTFHCAEQLIQYMKAMYFEDSITADAVLNSSTALECKRLARNIKNFNRDEWLKVAADMCDVGILEKFQQNKDLAKYLIETGSKRIVEASRDRDWGCGVSLFDDRCLYDKTWYTQGLLGKMLQDIRKKLQQTSTITGGNDDEEHVMETDSSQKFERE